MGRHVLVTVAAAHAALALGFQDLSQFENPSGVTEIDVALAEPTSSRLDIRRDYEDIRGEARLTASTGANRERAQRNLAALQSVERNNAARASEILSFLGAEPIDGPLVELSLEGSQNAYPSFSSALSGMEAARENSEAKKFQAFQAKAMTLMSQAQAKLTAAIGKARGKSSFFAPVEPSMTVDVVPGHADEGAAVQAVKALESKRQGAEDAFLDAAIAELDDIQQVVISEYEKAIGAHSSFMGGFSRMLNVRVTNSDGYPSITKLADTLEKRRDVSESALRAAVLDLELAFVKKLNTAAAAALRA